MDFAAAGTALEGDALQNDEFPDKQGHKSKLERASESRARPEKNIVWRPVGARRSIAIGAPSVKTHARGSFDGKTQQFQADRLYGLRPKTLAVNFASASQGCPLLNKMGGGAEHTWNAMLSRFKQCQRSAVRKVVRAAIGPCVGKIPARPSGGM